jgi:hypothetical protein
MEQVVAQAFHGVVNGKEVYTLCEFDVNKLHVDKIAKFDPQIVANDLVHPDFPFFDVI